jgi:23S rRNA (uracil1939-C5)-methyltransferase
MGKTFPQTFILEIESINLDGAGVGFYGKRPVSVFGAIPGDVVKVKPLKVSRNHSKAQLLNVITPSSERIDVRDVHYPSSSPWQPLPYRLQLEQKKKMLRSFFKQRAYHKLGKFDIEPSVDTWGYRTKIEYGFFENEQGMLCLGFRKRNRWRDFYDAENIALAPQKLVEVAQHILGVLREKKIAVQDLKSLVIRYSFYQKKCIAGLFVMNKNSDQLHIEHPDISGFHVVYSDPLSPVSKISETLYSDGKTFLTESVAGKKYMYHWNGFFQQNIPIFEKVIVYINTEMQSGNRIIDLYSGVGTIGIALSGGERKIIAIEADDVAARLSRVNAEKNNCQNYTHISSAVEGKDLATIIAPDDVVIVDPPRSGLHPDVVSFFVHSGPRMLVYISCNPKTQAMNMELLLTKYELSSFKLFDLYPHTPHVESVALLKRK